MLSALCAGSLLSTHAKYLFSTNFNSGRVPAVMSATDDDGTWGAETDYRNGHTTNGWTVSMISGGQYAAVSPSHTRSDVAQSNLLSTPAFTVSGTRPMIRWRGRSVHPALPEKYSVIITDKNSAQSTILTTIDAEDAAWRTRAIDISAWMGREVVVSFRCESTNRYLLAIDDIQIGDPEDINWQAHSSTREFAALWGASEGTAPIHVQVSNMGMPLQSGAVVLMSGETEIKRMELTEPWLCGDTLTLSAQLPVKLNTSTPYAVYIEDASMARTKVYEHRVVSSNFPRTLLMDEYTGLWCNNCPRGSLEIEKLQSRFGDQIIPLSVHINDALQCDDYRNEVTVYSIPYMRLNRNNSTAGDDASKFETEYLSPTDAMIRITGFELQDANLSVNAEVQWAADLDNTSDRYRIGYLLMHDVISTSLRPSMRQENALTTVASERFYFLPSKIEADLSPNYNVVATGEYAHSGRPYLMSYALKAFTPLQTQWLMPVPETVDDIQSATLVAYILDSTTGHILNATSQRLDRQPEESSAPAIEIDTNLNTDSIATEYYTLSGVRVVNPAHGIYIVRRGNTFTKEIL